MIDDPSRIAIGRGLPAGPAVLVDHSPPHDDTARMRRIFDHVFGTVLGIGHIPVVPATWTSLFVAALFWALQIDDLAIQIALLVLFTATGIPACGGLEREYGEDPKQATADEAAGQTLTLLAVPLDPITVGVGFVLFRIFDVLKPPPARQLEDLHGGLGIVADDLAAGVYARIALQLWIVFVTPILPAWSTDLFAPLWTGLV